MFALLNKNEVSIAAETVLPFKNGLADINGQHSQRRKLFAERYAMTNILNSTIIHGIQQNAAKVVQKCVASAGTYLDTYV